MPKKCRKHRSIIVRDTWSKFFVLFVGDKIYTNMATLVHPLNPKLKKELTTFHKDLEIRWRVNFDKIAGVNYAILSEEEWREIQESAKENELNYRLNLTKKYVNVIIRTRRIDERLKDLVKKSTKKFGNRYIKELIKVVENELEDERTVKNVLKTLLDRII